MARSSREIIKIILKRTPLYGLYRNFKNGQPYRQWVADGRPIPPPDVVKQKTVLEFADRFKISVFIETGTYLGHMVNGVREIFPEIYSIELGKELFERAQKEFAGFKHITILHGDSGEILGQILDRIHKPCLFWLDGHFSEGITARGTIDTPIKEELTHILKHSIARRHVILIDDARLFTGEHDYPTIQYLKELVEWWYAQNTLLFARADLVERNPALKVELDRTDLGQLSVVHPRQYLYLENRYREAVAAAQQAAPPSGVIAASRLLAVCLKNAVRKRLFGDP